MSRFRLPWLRPSRPRSRRVLVLVAAIAVIALVGVVATVAVAFSSNSGAHPSVSPAVANGSPAATTPGDSATPTARRSESADDLASAPAASLTAIPTNGPTPSPTSTSLRTVPAPTPVRTPTPGPTPPRTPAPTPVPTAPPSNAVVTILAAGDVRSNTDGIMATTRLIQGMPGLYVLNVGDDSANGTAAEYTDYFDPAWGQFKSRIFPTPGNHEYNTAGAAPYFAYYGSRAGNPGQGWYSFDFTDTSWHVIELNGNVAHGAGSAQETWLRRDLAANAGKHIIAFWHQPRFSSGTEHGSDTSYTAFWNDLEAAHADIVLNGHDHDYERFALQNGAGQVDPEGIREFVVGMGGTTERPFGGAFVANSEAHNDSCWGVLKLTLRAHSYDWQFVPVAGCSYRDSGTQATHS